MARCPECGKWIWTFLSNETECPKCGAILKVHRVFLGRFTSTWFETVGFTPSSAGARHHFARDPSFSKQEIVPGGLEGELGEATLPDYVEDEEENPSYRPLYSDRKGKDASKASPQQRSTGASRDMLSSQDKNVEGRRCIFCGAGIRQPDTKFCPSCGARLHLQPRVVASTQTEANPEAEKQVTGESRETHDCIVCNEELTEKNDVVWCPHCGQPAHRDHMVKWIREKGRCPNCGASLDERLS
ncbi:MAG: RING finger protein [Candidatus Atabeyarchaeum deiterrae]